MTQMIKTLVKFPIQVFLKYQARFSLGQLRSHEYSKLRAIGDALEESLTGTVSADEKEWIGLIEQRRRFLLNSRDKVAVIDYGAGSPGSNRTREEMAKGVQSTALVADICRASKPPFGATFLFKLIRKLAPSSCVELGSCVGISAAYQAAALTINGNGKLITTEGAPEIARIAKETLKGLKLQNATVVTGPFHETLKGVLESAKPIDFFFNDGHHDHDALIHYFNEAMPYLSNEAIIVFDDISWSQGMRKAWNEIQAHERVMASIDFRMIGVALIGNKTATKKNFRIPLA
jgi:predicted O-methyltransferase YrrM